jgi:hypothetical protein
MEAGADLKLKVEGHSANSPGILVKDHGCNGDKRQRNNLQAAEVPLRIRSRDQCEALDMVTISITYVDDSGDMNGNSQCRVGNERQTLRVEPSQRTLSISTQLLQCLIINREYKPSSPLIIPPRPNPCLRR